jgi:hypothetical protein
MFSGGGHLEFLIHKKIYKVSLYRIYWLIVSCLTSNKHYFIYMYISYSRWEQDYRVFIFQSLPKKSLDQIEQSNLAEILLGPQHYIWFLLHLKIQHGC